MIDPSIYATIRDIATLIVASALFIWGVKQTWKQYSPFVLPLLKRVRDQLLSDHIAEERAAVAAVEEQLREHITGSTEEA